MSTFDRDKYRRIFENRFGKGSFDAGLSQAREIGRTRGEANVAKKRYDEWKKERERLQKEEEAKASKPTFEDVVSYIEKNEINQIRKKGASVYAENIRNDPREQERIKNLGFNVSDFIDAMFYSVSPKKDDGSNTFRSEREYKQYGKGLEEQQTSSGSYLGGETSPTSSTDSYLGTEKKPSPGSKMTANEASRRQQSKDMHEDPSFFERIGDFFTGGDKDTRPRESILGGSVTPQPQPKKEEGSSLLGALGKFALKSAFDVTAKTDNSGIGQTIKGAIEPNKATSERTLHEQTGAALRRGTGSVLETLGGISDWGLPETTAPTLGKNLRSLGSKLSEGYESDYDKEFSSKSLLDPEWYTNRVAETLPTMGASFIPGAGTGLGLSSIATRLGLKGIAKYALPAVGAGAVTSTTDSAMNAGSVYNEAIKRGMSKEEAEKAANSTFKDNMIWNSGMDVAQGALTFTPIGKLTNKLGPVGDVTARAISSGGIEAFQEMNQGRIEANALGDSFSWTDPSTIEAGVIGAILGTGMTAGTATIDRIKNRTLENVTEETKKKYDKAYESGKRAGMTEEDAEDFAADQVADEPDFQEAVQTAVQDTIESERREVGQQSTTAEQQAQSVINNEVMEPQQQEEIQEPIQEAQEPEFEEEILNDRTELTDEPDIEPGNVEVEEEVDSTPYQQKENYRQSTFQQAKAAKQQLKQKEEFTPTHVSEIGQEIETTEFTGVDGKNHVVFRYKGQNPMGPMPKENFEKTRKPIEGANQTNETEYKRLSPEERKKLEEELEANASTDEATRQEIRNDLENVLGKIEKGSKNDLNESYEKFRQEHEGEFESGNTNSSKDQVRASLETWLGEIGKTPEQVIEQLENTPVDYEITDEQFEVLQKMAGKEPTPGQRDAQKVENLQTRTREREKELSTPEPGYKNGYSFNDFKKDDTVHFRDPQTGELKSGTVSSKETTKQGLQNLHVNADGVNTIFYSHPQGDKQIESRVFKKEDEITDQPKEKLNELTTDELNRKIKESRSSGNMNEVNKYIEELQRRVRKTNDTSNWKIGDTAYMGNKNPKKVKIVEKQGNRFLVEMEDGKRVPVPATQLFEGAASEAEEQFKAMRNKFAMSGATQPAHKVKLLEEMKSFAEENGLEFGERYEQYLDKFTKEAELKKEEKKREKEESKEQERQAEERRKEAERVQKDKEEKIEETDQHIYDELMKHERYENLSAKDRKSVITKVRRVTKNNNRGAIVTLEDTDLMWDVFGVFEDKSSEEAKTRLLKNYPDRYTEENFDAILLTNEFLSGESTTEGVNQNDSNDESGKYFESDGIEYKVDRVEMNGAGKKLYHVVETRDIPFNVPPNIWTKDNPESFYDQSKYESGSEGKVFKKKSDERDKESEEMKKKTEEVQKESKEQTKEEVSKLTFSKKVTLDKKPSSQTAHLTFDGLLNEKIGERLAQMKYQQLIEGDPRFWTAEKTSKVAEEEKKILQGMLDKENKKRDKAQSPKKETKKPTKTEEPTVTENNTVHSFMGHELEIKESVDTRDNKTPIWIVRLKEKIDNWKEVNAAVKKLGGRYYGPKVSAEIRNSWVFKKDPSDLFDELKKGDRVAHKEGNGIILDIERGFAGVQLDGMGEGETKWFDVSELKKLPVDSKPSERSESDIEKRPSNKELTERDLNTLLEKHSESDIETIWRAYVDRFSLTERNEYLGIKNIGKLEKYLRDNNIPFKEDVLSKPEPENVKAPKTAKVRENLSWLEKAEEDARKRLKSRGDRALSGLPMDDLVDYAIIGASKIAKKGLDYAEFTEEMINEWGDKIKLFMPAIYGQSQAMLDMTPEEVEEMIRLAAKDPVEERVEEKKNAPEPKTKEEFKQEFEGEFNDFLSNHIQYLKDSGGKGVQQGNVIKTEDGEITGRYGRVSNNPHWYQEFYKQHGRKPNNKEYSVLAQDHLLNGFSDEHGRIESWTPDGIIFLEEEEATLETLYKTDKNSDTKRLYEETRDELAIARVAFREFRKEKRDMLKASENEVNEDERQVDGGESLEEQQASDVPGTETGRETESDAREGSSEVRGNGRGNDTGDRENVPDEGKPDVSRKGSTQGQRSQSSNGRGKAGTLSARQKLDFKITNQLDERRGPKKRFEDNISAIETLLKIEKEGRNATSEEQETLVKYVGWGGLKAAFEEGKPEYETLRSFVKDGRITEQEYSEMFDTINSSFYTPPALISQMYTALDKMGFKSGQILESSVGTGNFIGLMPESVKANSNVIGVEKDSITSRIAKQLYQNAKINHKPFEDYTISDGYFDVAIGNVPFGRVGVSDKRYKPFVTEYIHDYFFIKSLDKVREGGIVAYVTSAGTMDKKSSDVRQLIEEKADLIGAIRLPENAFKSANTGVVSDIIFLQKRANNKEPNHAGEFSKTKKVQVDGKSFQMNEYFINHPEMVIGKRVATTNQHGDKLTFRFEGDFEQALTKAIENLPSAIYKERSEQVLEDYSQELNFDAQNEADDTIIEKNGAFFQVNEGQLKPYQPARGKAPRLKAMLGVREAANDLLRLEQSSEDNKKIDAARKKLNQVYDAFVKKFGYLNEKVNSDALKDDSLSLALVTSLEDYKESGSKSKGTFENSAKKESIFSQRVLEKAKPVDKVDTAHEALALSLYQYAKVNMEYMSKLSNKSVDQLESELGNAIFFDPERKMHVTSDEYLSGNVREKLRYAQNNNENGQYDRHIKELKNILPKWLEIQGDRALSPIVVSLGSHWIPTKYYEQFIKEVLDAEVKVTHHLVDGSWFMAAKGNIYSYANREDWGVKSQRGKNLIGTDIIENLMNQKDSKVTYTVDGKSFVDEQATLVAKGKADMLQSEFQNWLAGDSERVKDLENIYNETFNAVVLRNYNGEILYGDNDNSIAIPKMNKKFKLFKHQKDAVYRVIQGKNTLLAHVVGAGKTLEMVVAGMEGKRLGMWKKPMYVVPKPLLDQWEKEFKEAYPTAKILKISNDGSNNIPTVKPPKKKGTSDKAYNGIREANRHNRYKALNKVRYGDYDAILITHGTFQRLPVSPETEQNFIREQIEDLRRSILNATADGEQQSVKKLQQQLQSLEKKLKDNVNEEIKDVGIPFEELGIDQIFVDEAHMFKNLMFSTKMNNVAGLPRNYSQRAQDMFMKTKWLTETNDGRGVVFATGTPIANSVAELYTMIRYLNLPVLKQLGIDHFDSWASMFGKIASDMEMDATGAYKEKTRFASFHNLPELLKIFKGFADVKTAADLTYLDKPSKVDRITVEADMSPDQEAYLQDLQQRAAAVKSGSVDKTEDNYLKISGDGRKNALDGRIVQPGIDDYKGSKINLAVENIAEIYHETTKEQKDKKGKPIDKLAQLVFLDLGTPKKKNNKDNDEGTTEEDDDLEFEQKMQDSVYQDIKNKLIRQKVKPSEIAFIHDAKTDKQRLELFQKVRDGETRILIGSTEKMGAGMNVQDRLYALHHLDAPWRPADVEQREGRIIRQKNRLDNVKVYTYVTVGSFDAISWKTLQVKAKFINQVMTGDDTIRSAEDIDEVVEDYTNLAVAASGNPLMEELVKVQKQIKSLNASKQDYLRKKRTAQQRISEGPKSIKKYQDNIQAIESDLKIIDEATKAIEKRAEDTIQKNIKDFEKEGKVVTRQYDGLFVRDKDSKKGKTYTFPDPFAITLGGKEYTTRKEASEALAPLVINADLGDVIGNYLGLDIRVTSYGVLLEKNYEYNVLLDLDKPDGFITRISNRTDRISSDLIDAENSLKSTEEDLKGAKKTVNEPFKNEEELSSLLKREEEISKTLKGENKEEGNSEEVDGGIEDALVNRVNSERKGSDELGFVAFGSGKRSNPNKRKYSFADKNIQKRIDDAEEMPHKKISEVIKEWTKRQKARITREFENLPNTKEFSELRNRLLQLEKQRGVAMEKTANNLDALLIRLNRDQYELFRNIVLLRDLKEEAAFEHKLPYGFTPETLEKELKRQETFLDSEPDVKESLQLRTRLWDKIKKDYTKIFDEIGVDVKDRFKRRNYYRHIVIEHQQRQNDKVSAQKQLKTPKGQGYMKTRQGSELDILSDYLYAESEVMSNMLFDIEVAKTIQLVDKIYNKEPELRKEFKAENDRNFLKIIKQEITDFENEPKNIPKKMPKERQEIIESYVTAHGAKQTEAGSYIEGILKRFRSKRGYAMKNLRDLADNGDLWTGIDNEYEEVVESIKDRERHNDFMNYLAELAGTDTDGMKWARTFLSSISHERNFKRELLGKEYKDISNPKNYPEGHVLWQPDKGNIFFMANTLPEDKAKLLFNGLMDELTEGDFSKQLVMAGKKKGFIVKEEVAETLDNLMKPHGPAFETTKAAMRKLKSLLLIGPNNLFKYNARNMTGDVDKTIAANPDALKPRFLSRAHQELFNVMVKGKKPTGDLKDWLERGGTQTLVQSQEFGELKHLRIFKDKMIQKEMNTFYKVLNIPKKTWDMYWNTARKATDFREALLRYANYLSYLEQVTKGNGKPKNYGASLRHEIDGLSNNKDKAFNLANDMLIAYDKTSATGRELRDTLFPFWSFIEGNMRSYTRLFRNAYHDEALAGSIGRKILGTAVASPRLAYKTGKLVMKVGFITVLLQLWNELFFDDEEEELPEHVQESVHIIFGRNKDGEVVYFNRLGTLEDFLEWFGVDDIHTEVTDVMNGDKTFMESVGDVAIKPVNKLVQAVSPIAKQIVEQVSGMKFFPDFREPSAIYDRTEHLMSMFTFNKEYAELRDFIEGRPNSDRDWLSNWVSYSADIEESNYYKVKDMAQKDAKKLLGKDAPGLFSNRSEKSEALYEIKQGLKYGDREYAELWVKKYEAAGGTKEGFERSLKALHPLSVIPEKHRQEYYNKYLDEKEKERVQRAMKYYQETLLDGFDVD